MVWCRNDKIYNTKSIGKNTLGVVVWCRNDKIYNYVLCIQNDAKVVVWCRNDKIYNTRGVTRAATRLWFDVEMIRYTTQLETAKTKQKLWFDVEMIRYTTPNAEQELKTGCGLM